MINPRDITSVPAREMAVLQAQIPDEWPAAWAEFAAVFFVGLLRSDEAAVSIDVKARVAIAQVLVAAHQIGGQQLYLPRGARLLHQAMARSIRRDFTGNNHAELAARHGVTVMRVRQIVGAAARSPWKPREATQGTPKHK